MMFSTEIRSSLAVSNNATMTALEETAAAADIFASHRRFQQILRMRQHLSAAVDAAERSNGAFGIFADLATCSTFSNSP